MNSTLKNIAIWALIGFLVFLILDFFNANQNPKTQTNISYSEFLSQVDKGSINSVEIKGNNINIDKDIIAVGNCFPYCSLCFVA